MSQFNEYHKDLSQYPFLTIFKQKYQEIRNEYTAIMNDSSIDLAMLKQIMSPKSNTIEHKERNTWQALGLRFHGKNFLQIVEEYSLGQDQFDEQKIQQNLQYVFAKHFQITQQCITKSDRESGGVIRNVYFSVFAPDMDIKLHINHNPYTYRAYLGVFVPQGDCAMRICDEILYWQEGEITVLDHNYPHCPHNHTDQPRVALIIDFLKPDKDKLEMLKKEKSLIEKRMRRHPESLGVFGDEDYVLDEEFKKWGLQDQLNWNNSLR